MSTEELADHGGDGWAVTEDGTKFWGVVGAAGLFLTTPDRHVLLQLRAPWVNRGGTWAIPGGARNPGETAAQAALRETWEETLIDTSRIRVLGEIITAQFPLDHVLRREPVTSAEEYLLEEVKEEVKRTGDPRAALDRRKVVHPRTGAEAIMGLGAHWWWQVKDKNYSQHWTYTTVLAEADTQLKYEATAESTEVQWVHCDEIETLSLMPAFREALPSIWSALRELR